MSNCRVKGNSLFQRDAQIPMAPRASGPTYVEYGEFGEHIIIENGASRRALEALLPSAPIDQPPILPPLSENLRGEQNG